MPALEPPSIRQKNNYDIYEALSYVWGTQGFVAEILLDGEFHLVTRNLEMALRYLRLPTSQRTL